MRIRAYSDLHLEFGPFEPPASAGIDVVILAGDIDVKTRGIAFAKTFPCPVIYVPGNHEYYGGAIPHVTEKLKAAAAGTNVHVLDRDAVVINGTRFSRRESVDRLARRRNHRTDASHGARACRHE